MNFFYAGHTFYFSLSHYLCHVNGPVHRNFDLEGHRGCRGLMPENTIPAMLKAIDLNVNTLEMDVVITADKKVVVSHEPFFSHEITTLPSGDTIEAKDEWQYNIFHMTYDSVKLYDVGLKPHPRFPSQQKMKAVKPLLADLIDAVEAYLIKTNQPRNIIIISKLNHLIPAIMSIILHLQNTQIF